MIPNCYKNALAEKKMDPNHTLIMSPDNKKIPSNINKRRLTSFVVFILLLVYTSTVKHQLRHALFIL